MSCDGLSVSLPLVNTSSGGHCSSYIATDKGNAFCSVCVCVGREWGSCACMLRIVCVCVCVGRELGSCACMLRWTCNAGMCACACVWGLLTCTTTDPTSSHEGLIGGVYLE